jgi:hypothetical protein
MSTVGGSSDISEADDDVMIVGVDSPVATDASVIVISSDGSPIKVFTPSKRLVPAENLRLLEGAVHVTC